MAAIPVTISPVAAIGACSATCVSYHSGTKPAQTSHYDHIEYTNYQCSANVGAGWRFLRFEYTLRGTLNRDGGTYTETVRLTTNPAPLQQVTTDWTNPFEYEVIGDDGSVYMTIKEEIISVTAYFEQIPVHVPTHLLVNSFSRSFPVRLCHDPATGLLVADY